MIAPAKALFYLIEFINCYAAVYYSNFLFFFLKLEFGFGEVENLLTAALGGFVYIIASWQGGKYAERHGCIPALYTGFVGIVISLSLGLWLPIPAAQIIVFCLWTLGVCLIWPALEALISEKEGERLADRVGLYNVTWAAGGAVGYFTTGVLLERLGMASLFWLPILLTIVQMIVLAGAAALRAKQNDSSRLNPPVSPLPRPAQAQRFLRMAWYANPFSYVAINTVIPLIPSIADKMALSTGLAGMVCSLWMFARLLAFAALWRWTGWHYRFRWLAGAFALMIVSFFGFLTAPSMGILVAAQVGFGASIGLLYYSSLYYAMNASDKQSANAGLHEAIMGAGLFVGPAIGAAALYLAPAAAGIGAWSVGGLLCVGFSGLIVLRRHRARS